MALLQTGCLIYPPPHTVSQRGEGQTQNPSRHRQDRRRATKHNHQWCSRFFRI